MDTRTTSGLQRLNYMITLAPHSFPAGVYIPSFRLRNIVFSRSFQTLSIDAVSSACNKCRESSTHTATSERTKHTYIEKNSAVLGLSNQMFCTTCSERENFQNSPGGMTRRKDELDMFHPQSFTLFHCPHRRSPRCETSTKTNCYQQSPAHRTKDTKAQPKTLSEVFAEEPNSIEVVLLFKKVGRCKIRGTMFRLRHKTFPHINYTPSQV